MVGGCAVINSFSYRMPYKYAVPKTVYSCINRLRRMSAHAAMTDVRTKRGMQLTRFATAVTGRAGRRRRDDGLGDAGSDPVYASATSADRSSVEPTTPPSIPDMDLPRAAGSNFRAPLSRCRLQAG